MISEDGNGFFMTMYKEIEVEVTVNNEEEYVKSYNSLYGPRPYGYGPEWAKLMTVGVFSKTSLILKCYNTF